MSFAVEERLPYDSHESVVRVETAADTNERRQTNPPWTHDDPLSEAELRTKFEECAGAVLADEAVGRLYDALSSLSATDNVAGALADAK